MNFVNNWFEVGVKSASTWLTWFVTFLGSYMGIIASDLLSEADKIAFHVEAQLHYIPIALAFIGILGGPVARGVQQKSVQRAAAK